MKRKTTIILACLFYLSSCLETSHYLKISDFKIEKNALKNFEPIKIIFVGPTNEFTGVKDYYNQLIVVSKISGDTINVLYSDISQFKENEGDISFYFVDPKHIVNAVVALVAKQDSTITKSRNDTTIQSYSIGDYEKVILDPYFLKIAKNHFPTTFGKVVRDTTHIIE